ncbi:fungal-specific transcription factor-like protein [Microthyrium microscopicum]|uniref:Fungal-specific transcription factor-like protein n=1 Tax=Microthyrium microscopicum TaxID=703497 RepID=A0A6A6U891_9PEZI|nr:fungal-specific transcription factor-like protein [Microthyrium microscopicum]
MDSPEQTSSNGPAESGSAKRKADDNDQPRTRAKRNRYISIACNECKRRKIKCNGQNPCQRCGNLSLECVYAPNCCINFKDSEEFQHVTSQISTLQQQVDQMNATMGYLRTQLESRPTVPESPSRNHRRSISVSTPTISNSTLSNVPRPPRFHGPTSAAFNFGVAKSSLRNIGITAMEENGEEGAAPNEQSGASTPPPIHTEPHRSGVHESKDPIWAISREEATRLVQSWKDNVFIMYPLIDLDTTLRHVDLLYNFLDGSRRAGLMMSDLPGADSISDVETNKLKLLLASALTMENSGTSDLGERLFRSVAESVESLLLRPPDLRSMEQLTLAAVYAFHRDDEVLAWRLVGIAIRMGFELGLHKQQTYANLASQADRYRSTVLMWTLYVLDRRWSFGTGLPFLIQDCDMDPMLLRPDSPYLSNMIDLTAITSKIWPHITNSSTQAGPHMAKDMELLDYEVIQWYRNLPPNLKYDPNGRDAADQGAIFRIRILLYLRANQSRILIGRPLFLSTNTIMANITYADTVINVAKDSIRLLAKLDRTTPFYRTQQVLFNYFLVSALAALFLAVAHAPAEFSEACRDEFYMALELVKGMSTNSFIGRRLWRTIKVLKEVGPMIGMSAHTSLGMSDAGDAHSNAAVAMAGLAGGHSMGGMQMRAGTNAPVSLPETWDGMTTDLTNLFESAGGTETARDGQVRFLANQDGVSRMFSDLF